VVVAAIVVAYLRRALGLLRPVQGYSLLLMLMATWDILFSPFSLRPRWAVVICICVLSLGYLRRRGAPADGEAAGAGDWDGTWEPGQDG